MCNPTKDNTTMTTQPSSSSSSPSDDASRSSRSNNFIIDTWLKIHDAVPRIYLWNTDFDVSITLATIALFSTIRFSAQFFILEHMWGWPSDSTVTRDAAPSFVSIFHSVTLVPALAALLFYAYGYNPSQRLFSVPAAGSNGGGNDDEKDPPKWYRDCVVTLLQYCTGYMVYDGILNIVLLKGVLDDTGLSASDFMFLGHHLATALYMTSTRLVGAGHDSAMMCMFLGEVTNPLHNSFMIAEAAQQLECCNGPLSQQLFLYISVVFSAAYVAVRAAVGPVVCGHMTYNLWRYGKQVGRIPYWLIAVWTFLIWAVIVGSLPWIQDCWNTLVENKEMLLPFSVAKSVSSEL